MLFLLVLLVPGTVLGGEHLAKFVAVKKVDTNRMFAYQCVATGNMVEVEQRYNSNAKAEEIRFLVNHQYDEWITKGVSPDLYHFLMAKACEESTSKTVAILDK